MYRRMSKAERESEILRKDAGYLDVGDEKLFHAAAVKTYDPRAWRWRIFFPSGHPLTLKVASGEIPKEGLPTVSVDSSRLANKRSEMILNVSLRQDKDDQGFIYLALGDQNSESYDRFPLSDSVAKQISDGNGCYNSHIFGAAETAIQEADKPIVLLRHRLAKKLPSGGYDGETSDPMPGIMIWLEAEK